MPTDHDPERRDAHRDTSSDRPPASGAMSPAERSLRGHVGANVRWSREDPKDPAGPLARARAAFETRFYEDTPDDLPAQERDRRAAKARQAHYQQLALRSARARRKKSAPRDGAA